MNRYEARKDKSIVVRSFDEEAKIRELLLGHRVAKITDDSLQLDDGTVITVVPNEGGCACSAGDYQLDALNGCDNIITAVEFETETPDPKYPEDLVYRVYVVAVEDRVNLYAVSGSDGNGYYGTGYELFIKFPATQKEEE